MSAHNDCVVRCTIHVGKQLLAKIFTYIRTQLIIKLDTLSVIIFTIEKSYSEYSKLRVGKHKQRKRQIALCKRKSAVSGVQYTAHDATVKILNLLMMWLHVN